MTGNSMDGLSKEERRKRALEMLKAKTQPPSKSARHDADKARAEKARADKARADKARAPTTGVGKAGMPPETRRVARTEPVPSREEELAARERELQERAARLDELEHEEELARRERERRAEEAALERDRQAALDARERELEAQARELEARERELSRQRAERPPERRGKATDDDSAARLSPAKAARGIPEATKAARPTEETPAAPVSLVARVRRRTGPDPAVTASTSAAPRSKGKAGGQLLGVEGIDVHYGKIQALRGVDISIKKGEVVALLGANGAGKSSTLRAISGMVAPSSGTITFDGEPIAGLPAFEVVKHGISHVPEGRELFPTLAVEENLRLGYWPQRRVGSITLNEALDRVYTMFPRLGERRTQAAGTMSGGEQQMLAFGRALMPAPRLLLVDEMSLGLAPLIVQTLFDAVEQIHSEGASVIIVEQFVHKALKHAQRAYVLSKGEVVLEAPASKLANDPNLLAAYLGGAEGHIEEEAEPPATSGSPARGRK